MTPLKKNDNAPVGKSLPGITTAKLLAHIANGDDDVWLNDDDRETDGDAYVATVGRRSNDN